MSRRREMVSASIDALVDALRALGPDGEEHVRHLRLMPPIPEPKGKENQRNEHFSVSRVKLAEQCMAQYGLKYVPEVRDRYAKKLGVEKVMPIEEDAIPPELGKLLHKVQELTNQWIVNECYEGPYPSDMAQRLFREYWPRFNLSGVEHFSDGMDMLRKFVSSQGSVDHMKIMAIERYFEIDLGGFRYVGYLDLVERTDANTARIVDYKSNRMLFTSGELSSDLQMSIYGLVAKQEWPWAENIEYEFEMLRWGMRQRTRRSLTQLDDAKQYAIAMATKMETATEFPETANSNCIYCPFRHVCDTYKRAVENKDERVAYKPDDLAAMGMAYDQADKLSKIYYKRKKEIEEVMIARLQHQDRVHAGPRIFQMTTQQNRFYPATTTLPAVAKVLGESVETVSKKLDVGVPVGKLEELVKQVGTERSRSLASMLELSLERCVQVDPVRKIDVPQAAKAGAKKAPAVLPPEVVKP